jgi:quinol monooxygenase YgiN
VPHDSKQGKASRKHTSSAAESFQRDAAYDGDGKSDFGKASAMKKDAYTLSDLNTGFVVVVMLEAAEGQADAVMDIQRRLIGPTLQEPGVKAFIPYRSTANPSLFFIYELYIDEAAWGMHQETPHFKNLIKELLPRLKRRERIPFVPFMAI